MATSRKEIMEDKNLQDARGAAVIKMGFF